MYAWKIRIQPLWSIHTCLSHSGVIHRVRPSLICVRAGFLQTAWQNLSSYAEFLFSYVEWRVAISCNKELLAHLAITPMTVAEKAVSSVADFLLPNMLPNVLGLYTLFFKLINLMFFQVMLKSLESHSGLMDKALVLKKCE